VPTSKMALTHNLTMLETDLHFHSPEQVINICLLLKLPSPWYFVTEDWTEEGICWNISSGIFSCITFRKATILERK
jgi:hypothetical protein